GVYMVTRCNVLFRLAPEAMLVVAAIGTFTAIFAAIIGVAQNDIKKVLAYSTVSQLGYMFMACGVGAYVAGMFHVMTHAFFKACLTAFYMFRLVSLTFHGAFRGGAEAESRIHEAPASMTVPLIVLAVLSTVGGWVGLPAVFGRNVDLLRAFLTPVLLPLQTSQ